MSVRMQIPWLVLGAVVAACEPQPHPVTPVEAPPPSLHVATGDVPTPSASAMPSAAPSAEPAAPPCDDLVVRVGRPGGHVPLTDVKSFAVSMPGIVSVAIAPGGANLTVTGKTPGTATLRFVHKDGHEENFCVRVEP
jgi:hypothetical protein